MYSDSEYTAHSVPDPGHTAHRPTATSPARRPPSRAVTAWMPSAATNEHTTDTAIPAPYGPSPVTSETSRISAGYSGKNAAELPSSVISPVAPGTGSRAGS